MALGSHESTDLAHWYGEPMRIGFIGLGAMGAPMATRIHSAQPPDTPLVVHARRPESAAGLLARGAVWAESAAALAARVDVVLTMLPDLPELREQLEGPSGILAGAGGPLTVVVCSTSSAAGTRELGAELAEVSGGRVTLVDAPVSGGVEGAAEGTLSIFLGGSAKSAGLAEAALAACGTAVHLGPLGSGQVAKAANQLVVAATMGALGEALAMAERSGLDLATLVPLLAGGYAGSRLLEVKGQRFIDRDYSPASPAGFMIKDLSFAQEIAAHTGTDAQVLAASQSMFTNMVAAGLGDLDTSAVLAHLSGR